MAKEKKRGFFSWLGLGQKEDQQHIDKEHESADQSADVSEAAATEHDEHITDAPATHAVALEDAVNLLGLDARPLVVDSQFHRVG